MFLRSSVRDSSDTPSRKQEGRRREQVEGHLSGRVDHCVLKWLGQVENG